MYAATVGADPRVRPDDRTVTTHVDVTVNVDGYFNPEYRTVTAHVDVFGRAHRPSPTVAVNALN